MFELGSFTFFDIHFEFSTMHFNNIINLPNHGFARLLVR